VEQIIRCSSLLEKYSDQIGVHLQAVQLNQFMLYFEQLQVWNRSINLTGITLDEEIVIKHFVDSLAGLTAEEIKHGASLLDVGTGAGFPGIPLKIARRDLEITLIEPAQRKVSFLYSIVGLLHLENVKIFYGTLEQFIAKMEHGGRYDYITTRALKYDVILRNGTRLLADGGRVILYSSHPFSNIGEWKEWSIVTEQGFDLPMGCGHRVVSILSPL
jgi:16S rRNA (guanine527-N7)-methyltransferase